MEISGQLLGFEVKRSGFILVPGAVCDTQIDLWKVWKLARWFYATRDIGFFFFHNSL